VKYNIQRAPFLNVQTVTTVQKSVSLGWFFCRLFNSAVSTVDVI